MKTSKKPKANPFIKTREAAATVSNAMKKLGKGVVRAKVDMATKKKGK